ncbi:MAG: metallopeptidase TldD-related protein, partial [Lachnospiraceae bacterium]
MNFEYVVKKERFSINGTGPIVLMGKSIYSGKGDNLFIRNNILRPIRNLEKYDEDMERCISNTSYIIERLKEEVEDGWHFELYYLQKTKSFSFINSYSQFSVYVEMFKNKQSMGLFLVENMDKLDEEISKIKNKYLKIDKIPYLGINLERPILFSGQAAGILSHELLGHIFEIDNFFMYQYEKLFPLIEKLNIDIVDLPSMKNGLGFYLYDDMGICYKDVTICSNGRMTGKLIGGECTRQKIVHALRRDDYTKSCMPRMSNLYINNKKENFITIDTYIEITKLGKCYINHKKGILEISIEQGAFCLGGKYMARVNKGVFMLSIVKLIDRMSAVGRQNTLCPLQCQKQGQ